MFNGAGVVSGIVNSEHAQVYKTLITQEMLKKGYLAGNSVYVTLAHTPELIDAYFDALAPVWQQIAECETKGTDPTSLLEGPVAHSGFSRLN